MVTVVFSLTAHESADCLDDLIQNIGICFEHFTILIFISLTSSLAATFENKYSHVTIVTTRPDSLALWGRIDLFHQHILNMKYLLDTKQPFDYFIFVASNQMFLRKVETNFFDLYYKRWIPRTDRDNSAYVGQWPSSVQLGWYWWDHVARDTHFVDYVHRNKYQFMHGQHEGMVLEEKIVREVYQEYIHSTIYEKTTHRGYPLEEIFVHTFVWNNYQNAWPLTCCLQSFSNHASSLSDIQKKDLKPFQVSYKPVPRRYNHPLRNEIRRNLFPV